MPDFMASFAPKLAPIICPMHIIAPGPHSTFPPIIKSNVEIRLITNTIEREYASALLNPYPARPTNMANIKEPIPTPKSPPYTLAIAQEI